MFLRPAHALVCASEFVNCEFSFTEALIKDPTVSSRHHHPARVSLYITVPRGDNTFLFLDVYLSHPSISCGADTRLHSNKLHNHGIKLTANNTNTFTTVTVIIAVTLIILLLIYYSNLEQHCCRLKNMFVELWLSPPVGTCT